MERCKVDTCRWRPTRRYFYSKLTLLFHLNLAWKLFCTLAIFAAWLPSTFGLAWPLLASCTGLEGQRFAQILDMPESSQVFILCDVLAVAQLFLDARFLTFHNQHFRIRPVFHKPKKYECFSPSAGASPFRCVDVRLSCLCIGSSSAGPLCLQPTSALCQFLCLVLGKSK